MKTTKILLLVLALGICGCTASPPIPVLTADHPASAEGAEGKVDVMAIPLTNDSLDKTAKHSPAHHGMNHDMSKMKGVGGMNMEDK